VFADIRNLIKDENGVLVKIPTVVRLQPLDHCNEYPRDPGESIVPRVAKLFRGLANRERSLFGGLLTISNNYVVNEIIEDGHKILSEISDGQGDARWDGMQIMEALHEEAIDVFMCIQHGMAGVALAVPVKFGFDNGEMVFSPSKLSVR
jgi:hypothetical protein